jgi:nucleotide-binding universal stress UspA family protein
MFERILLPLDGSALAEMAIPYGKELGKRFGSELILYHVQWPAFEQHDRMHKVYLDWLAENMKHEMEKGQPKGMEVKVTAKIVTGELPVDVCSFVEKNNIGLIIMTSKGGSSHGLDNMLGTMADYICRTVPIPIMLIKPNGAQETQGKKLINRILLTVDGSDLSKRAIPITEELSEKLKTSVTLFQMAQMMHHAPSDVNILDYTKLNKAEEQRVRTEMIDMERELREKGLTVTHRVTTGTDAADEIIEAAKEVGCDLIVMSSHGRSGLGRWLMGSVTQKVLQYGDIPLLLINARSNI